MSEKVQRPPVIRWVWLVAIVGLAWNVFGIFQFLSSVQGTVESMMAGGLTKEQAELYLGLPGWMHAAFGTGVFAGAIGSVLLLLRNRMATPVFALSLAAYGVLYIGDITQGVFAAFGWPQVAVLTTVVAIAVGLLWVALRQQGSLAPDTRSAALPTVLI